jgi:hypothetical protein
MSPTSCCNGEGNDHELCRSLMTSHTQHHTSCCNGEGNCTPTDPVQGCHPCCVNNGPGNAGPFNAVTATPWLAVDGKSLCLLLVAVRNGHSNHPVAVNITLDMGVYGFTSESGFARCSSLSSSHTPLATGSPWNPALHGALARFML